jgi:putative membrane protein
MSSERRLHPVSILLNLGKVLGDFLLPAVLVFFAAQRAGESWRAWLALLLVPYTALAVGRYLTYRFRYGADALIVRSGVLFKRTKHIPYARIQNLDARQNPVHRLFRVVQVRVETGAGAEPEAILDVLPYAELAEMRRRVLGNAGGEAAAPEGETLLTLSAGELLLAGFIENRGMVLILALVGVIWESGLAERLLGAFGIATWGQGLVDELSGTFAGGSPPPGRLLLLLGGLAGLLLGLRILSMLWALIRLYDFRLTRVGEDLRTQYGLFTRVTTTIPLRRVQSVILRQQLLHRAFDRTALRVVTAGGIGLGGGQGGRAAREWLAPIVPPHQAAELLRIVLPGCALEQVEWQPPHPGTFGRLARRWLLGMILGGAGLVAWLGWSALWLVAVAGGAGLLAARARAGYLGWASAFECVFARDGALTKRIRVARTQRVQAVGLTESPFDRRTGMARVRADTAGTAEAFGLEMPYLPRDTAVSLHQALSRAAATTELKW